MDLTPITEQAVNFAITIIGLLGSWAVLELRKFIASRTENERLKNVLLMVTDSVEASVRRVSQELVPQVREAAADGKITTEERERLRQEALRLTKQHMGAGTLGCLADKTGLDDAGLDDYLITRIEAAVFNMKPPGSGQATKE